MYRVWAMSFHHGLHNALLRFRLLCLGWLRGWHWTKDDFVPTDHILKEIFGNENSVESLDSDEESYEDRQLENETEESK